MAGSTRGIAIDRSPMLQMRGEYFAKADNAENRLSVVTKLLEGTCETPVKTDMQWDFAYDGDGVRARQVVTTFDPETQDITGTSITSYFAAGLYEETDGVRRKYYAISGMTVAMSDANGLKYLLTDHLGSVVAVTDEDGELLDQQRYEPFGRVRDNVGSITQTDLSYTGQRAVTLTGLMDYKARAYDPLLMRFIQPDSIIPNPADPQGWNRYSYVLNGPIVYYDPTGHFLVEGTDCTQASCSGDPIFAPHIIRENEKDPKQWEDLTTGDQSILAAAGIGPGWWTDTFFGNATDVGGTLQDPAVYVAFGVGCVVSGLCLVIAQGTVWYVTYACLSFGPCSNVIAPKGVTVLGSYLSDPSYVRVARNLNANFLNLPPREWTREANVDFINQIAREGQTVFCSSDWTRNEATVLYEEGLQLLELGYHNILNVIAVPPP